MSIQGAGWGRTNDTIGVAGVLNAASQPHREFLGAGGTGILAGDGALTYRVEEALEIYYQLQAWRMVYVTLDYQFIAHPAFNTDRGPVSVIAARGHWEF